MKKLDWTDMFQIILISLTVLESIGLSSGRGNPSLKIEWGESGEGASEGGNNRVSL